MNKHVDRLLPLMKKLIKMSTHHQHRLSCIILDKGKIVSAAYNEIKTHPKSIARYNMLHAEQNCLIGHDPDALKGCTAYIYRERRDGLPGTSKPCPECEKALKCAGIKKVIFSSETGWKEEVYG